MDIGIAGIGRMGKQFAMHLSAAGHRVSAYDRYVTRTTNWSVPG